VARRSYLRPDLPGIRSSSWAAVLSDSKPGAPVAREFFPHLQSAYPALNFHRSRRHRVGHPKKRPDPALFSAAPHGVAAGHHRSIAQAPPRWRATRTHLRRHLGRPFDMPPRGAYEAVYKACAWARRNRISPIHLRGAGNICGRSPTPHVSHPGCFATATPACERTSAGGWGLTDTRPLRHGASPAATGSGPQNPAKARHHPQRHKRFIQLRRIESSACAGDHGPVQSLRRESRRNSTSSPHSGAVRTRHPTSPCRPASKRQIGSAQALEALSAYYQDCPFRAGDRHGAAGQGCCRPAITRI